MKPGDRYKSRVTDVVVTVQKIEDNKITVKTDAGSVLTMSPETVFFSYFEEVPGEGRDQG